MKIAIMQPYFFPYEGYFQLIRESDLFVFLTDVQFNRSTWITRNKLCNNNILTVPVVHSKQRQQICEAIICEQTLWRQDHLAKIKKVYGGYDHPILSCYQTKTSNLCDFLKHGIISTMEFLGIQRETIDSRKLEITSCGADRILDICKVLGATEYLNLPGGKSLYDTAIFGDREINLKFIETTQYKKVSILDQLLKTSSQ